MITPLQPGSIRIGTAEREQAAASLGEHFAAGRLDSDEFDERVARVYQAKTNGDLEQLFADLPKPAQPTPPQPRSARPRPRLLPVMVLLLVLASVAWVVFMRYPPFFIFPLVWIMFAGRIRYARRMRYQRWTVGGSA